MYRILAACFVWALFPAAALTQPAIDVEQLLGDLRYLSSDPLQGRAVGTEGNRLARWRVEERFKRLGLLPLDGTEYLQRFTFGEPGAANERQGVNVVGYVRGTALPDLIIVVTAHFDHLGVRGGEIYNGADDNASGSAALLAAAAHFVKNAPRHSIVFAALDAEEAGLLGAHALVAALQERGLRPRLNVNMDMIGRSEKDELYVAGTHHYPFLRPLLERAPAVGGITLRFGHVTPALGPRDDWTMSSDHGAFHAAGIPFVYFGVEDHPDYHEPTDDFERIDPAFFERATRLIMGAVSQLDSSL